MRSFLLSVLLAAACAVVPLRADAPSLSGLVLDPSGLPLPGVAVILRSAGDGRMASAITDSEGRYEFKDVTPGVYDLDATLDGFNPARRTSIDLQQDQVHLDLRLTLSVVHQDVTVVAPAPTNLIGSAQPNAPVTVTRNVMDVAMLPNSQFDDVLPLLPNVVRGPDGMIAVGGARAESGGLFVDGISTGNPISGGPGFMLPLEAVDNMQVYAGGAPAEYTGATGGITAATTRAGTDQFHLALDSFFPRLLYTENGVSGIAFWDPNLGFGGPLVRGRATFQQAVSYRYDRNTFTTLQGPDHNVFEALYSWTQVDARLSGNQRLRASVGFDPRVTDRANITAFTPSASAPRVEQGGWTMRVADAITAGRTLVELQGSSLRTQAIVQPHGSDPYLATHQATDGSYFDTQERQASTFSAGARVSWTPVTGTLVTAGASMSRAHLSQAIEAATVDLFRSDGSLARRVISAPSPGADVESTTLGLFIEGHATPRRWLTIDAGVRYDETTDAGDPPLSPRVGWTLSGDHGRTTLSGSAGVFADVLPLGALAFPALSARQILVPSAGGAYSTTRDYVFAPGLHVPQATRWDLELDRRSGPWSVRVRYEERRASHELLVQPTVDGIPSDGAAIEHVVLGSNGSSRARSFETTAGLRSSHGDEFYVSYVRATTWGDQNSLDATEGLLRPTFEQINMRGPLPIDVPHRVLAWGLLHLPGQFTVAPFLETRSGFPFIAITDDWLLAESPGTHRLPWMASLDLSATRIIGLPHHLPDARVGIKLYNIVSVNTEREVQRDIDRGDFGSRYDPVPRDFSVVFEFLWGKSR